MADIEVDELKRLLTLAYDHDNPDGGVADWTLNDTDFIREMCALARVDPKVFTPAHMIQFYPHEFGLFESNMPIDWPIVYRGEAVDSSIRQEARRYVYSLETLSGTVMIWSNGLCKFCVKPKEYELHSEELNNAYVSTLP